ncbi:phospholipase C/P1 nuclease [Choiromyces venosus 120613-1]|uniref:Phospholipase C/P1 nuclease n=1 Tax=Choiromyces venosus 120613-1 TaxID=1336337 RepID=A0A3N4JTP8_9PEZI|nr:phospholipase C/P1 nuclease [Choiromyces venosus 120613-1]
MRPANFLLPVLPLVSLTSAWGMLGHRTVALLSTRYLLPETAKWIRELLGKESIVAASIWPDSYSHTKDGRYSAPWHWIDAKDNPPHTCEIRYSRDCKTDHGCIVSALVNMTGRVTDEELSHLERAMALKFIIHFIGDIHQPLHTENLLRGGNGIQVTFDGKEDNLHRVWDSAIAEKHIGGNTIQDAATWSDNLHTEIETGKFEDPSIRKSWSGCIDPKTPEKCALVWAGESNEWMCDYVLPANYPEGFAGSELGGDYYEGAVPIVEESVAKAGWRLAGYLNMIVVGETGLSTGVKSDGFWDQSDFESGRERPGRKDRETRITSRGPKKFMGQIGAWWGNVRAEEL